MKKLFLILLLSFLFFGCDGVEDSIVDPNDGEFSVTNISAPTTLYYSGSDTKLNTSITFSDSKSILRAWISLTSLDGTVYITSHKDMEKSAEHQYSASVEMEEEMPSLTYTIDYFYQTEIQTEKKIASHNFDYDNMQNNVAPIISNPLFYYSNETTGLIDTIENGTINEFIVSIEVADENGLSDIDSVYVDLFNFQDPNNTTITKKIPLFDDGSVDHGDDFAGDGIYSRKGYFPDESVGDRRFEFIAIDRGGLRSNIVTHNFVVVK